MKNPILPHALFMTLVILAVFVALQPVVQTQTDFYNNLWTPVRLLTKGESPYDTESLQPDLPALWMPTVVGFFSFLGFFDFASAQQAWFLFNITGLAILLSISMSPLRSMPALIFGAGLAYFFPPAINHFVLGQITIILVLCLLLAVRFMKSSSWLSAFFLSLGLAKPQIAFLVLFGICVHEFQRDGLSGVFRYGLKTSLASLTLSLPLFIAYPNWVPDWFASLQANTLEWTHPSILSQLDGWIGNWKFVPWGLMLIAAFWVTARMWMKRPPQTAVMWSLALTLLVTPYVWSWDFVLLLPLFVIILSRANWKGIAVLLAGYGLAWAGMAFIQLSPDFHNSRFWWMPPYFTLLLTFIASRPSLQNPDSVSSWPVYDGQTGNLSCFKN